MQLTDRTVHKIEEKTIFLLCDLEKIVGKLDPETFERIQYMIYSALAGVAEDVVLQAWAEGKSECQNNQIS